MSMKEKIIKEVQKRPRNLILPEYMDDRMYFASQILLEKNYVQKLSMVGIKTEIEEKIQKLNLSIDRINIIDMNDNPFLESAIKMFYELRKNKGLTFKEAEIEVKTNPLVLASLLLRMGETDAVVAGAHFSSSSVVRTGIQVVGLREGVKTVSSSFFMERINEQFMFGDCAVNIDPTAEQLVDIAIETAKNFKTLTNIDPVVAFLSFSTYGSAKHPMTEKVVQAIEILKTLKVDFEFDGEFQFDSALLPSIRLKKAPESKVKKPANCFIFPNLDSGNIGYKIAQRLGNFQAFGPILQGLKKSYNDLSRGCSVEDIVMTSLITLLQSCHNE